MKNRTHPAIGYGPHVPQGTLGPGFGNNRKRVRSRSGKTVSYQFGRPKPKARLAPPINGIVERINLHSALNNRRHCARNIGWKVLRLSLSRCSEWVKRCLVWTWQLAWSEVGHLRVVRGTRARCWSVGWCLFDWVFGRRYSVGSFACCVILAIDWCGK